MISFFKNIINQKQDDSVSKDAVIVDVRSKNEFASGHVKGAVNIPLEQLESATADLKQHAQVVVYCRSGNRSAHAKKILHENGVENVVDAGSLENVQTILTNAGFDIQGLVRGELPSVAPDISALKDENVLKVLIPTDFSVQADFSYLMVRKLEEHLSVDIHFLHVIDVPDTVTLDESGNIDTCGEIDENFLNRQKSIAEGKLLQLKSQYGDHVSVHLRFGKLTDTIIHFSHENKYDLIVMGTKGAWGVKEKLTSTQAQMIVRKSSIPVLSLMCDRSDLIIHDILFVHDFINVDDTDMHLMRTFARYFNAGFHLLYVHDGETEMAEEVERLMNSYAEAHGLKNYQNHVVVAKDVETGVHDFLATQDADIVFVGTHGKGGFFYKSVAESLVKHLFKPIISFHFNAQ